MNIIYINMCIHLSYIKQLAYSGIYFVGHENQKKWLRDSGTKSWSLDAVKIHAFQKA